MAVGLVELSQVEEYDALYAKGFDHAYPDLDLVRLERWYFKRTPGRVLDYGCGTGENLLHLLRSGYTVDGVDASREACHLVGRKLAHYPEWREHTVIRHLPPDAVRLPYEDESFDYVVCLNVLSHLVLKPRIALLLEEFRRIMRPGAGLLVSAEGLRTTFASQGRSVGDDVYEFSGRRGDAVSTPARLRFIARSEEQMRELLGAFAIEEVGFSAFKYSGIEEFEYIVCARKAS